MKLRMKIGVLPFLFVVALSAAASSGAFVLPRIGKEAAVNYRMTSSGSGGGIRDGAFGSSEQSSIGVESKTVTKSQSRRNLIMSSLLIPISQLNAKKAKAACLQGDIREDCIGVYKLPMDDAALPYVETPEKLQKYAPDLKWVEPIEYPKSYQNAITQIKEQRQNFDVIQEKIAKGEIKDAGLILLDIIPKVTAAGIFIVRSYSIAANNERNKAADSEEAKTLDMKSYRIEYALNECLGYLGETDVLIGQALRGELGVSAPAQLAILDQLGDARKEFDELLRVVPDQF